jgi:hypothetical protein
MAAHPDCANGTTIRPVSPTLPTAPSGTFTLADVPAMVTAYKQNETQRPA